MSPTAPDPNLMLDLLFLGKTVSIFLRNDGVASSRSIGDYVCSNLKRRSSDIQWSSRGKTLKTIESTPSSRFLSILIRLYFSNLFSQMDIFVSCLKQLPSATRGPLAVSLKYLEKKESEYLRDNTQHCIYYYQSFTSGMRSRSSVINAIRNAWVDFDENPIKFFNIHRRYPAEFKESLFVKGLTIKRLQCIRGHAEHSSIQGKDSNLRVISTFTTKAGHIVVIERRILHTSKYKNQFLDLHLTNKPKRSILRPTRRSTRSTIQ